MIILGKISRYFVTLVADIFDQCVKCVGPLQLQNFKWLYICLG